MVEVSDWLAILSITQPLHDAQGTIELALAAPSGCQGAQFAPPDFI
jgi:hypothetical protein